jgi:tRNA U34 5-methylaminomethyl-2-thiouridine-forming methyltransferase MnmC
MNNITMIVTADGSHSLLNTALDETYHSRHGALQESVHVFIKEGLAHWLNATGSGSVSILEVGFGTGLNALLTARYAEDHPVNINYVSLEAFPLSEDIWSKLNYSASGDPSDLFKKLHQAGWNGPYDISPGFTLTKLHQTLQQVELPLRSFDLIYYDAFAPAKQPEMWTYDALGKVVNSMREHSVFVTYCAKGQLKRDLRDLGLVVETLEGPPGKKEMIRAVKP